MVIMTSGSVAQLTDRLTYENGVAVIFAASNSGGSGGGGECSGDLERMHMQILLQYLLQH